MEIEIKINIDAKIYPLIPPTPLEQNKLDQATIDMNNWLSIYVKKLEDKLNYMNKRNIPYSIKEVLESLRIFA